MVLRRTWAVLVGIDRYRFLPRLRNAVKGVVSLKEILIRDFNVEPRMVTVLTDAGANRKALLRLINDTIPRRWNVKGSDQLLLFFAGHADVALKNRRRTWYLAPVDAKVRRGTPDWETVITGSDIRRLEETFTGAHVLNVLDACYSGMQYAADVPKERKVRVNSSFAIVAGRGGDPVLDEAGAGHSMFTESLLTALSGWAGLGAGNDPTFKGGELGAFAQRDVPQQIRKRNLHPIQRPFVISFKGNEQGEEFTFVPTAPRLPPSLVQLLRSDRVDARKTGVAGLSDPTLSAEGDLIVSALQRSSGDDSPLVRVEVCSQLAAIKNSMSVELLDQLLKDVDVNVAIAAARALPQAANGSRKAAIQGLNKVRPKATGRFLRAINFALAQLGEEQSVRAVLRDLPTEEGSIRREIIDLLRHLPSSTISRTKLTDLLQSQLRSDEWRQRRAAAEAVGELGLEGAVGTLARLATTSSEHYMVRSSAAEALGHIGRGPARDAIRQALRADPSLLVRTAAAESLGVIGGAEAATDLTNAMGRDDEWRVRRAAAEACGILRDTQAVPMLSSAADDAHFRVRIAVAWALGEIGTENARQTLEFLSSHDRSLLVKQSARRALERMGAYLLTTGPQG
jgi:HEAT repeat protein